MPEVHIFLAAGRTEDVKKKLMKAVSDAVVTSIGSPLENVTVQIIDSPQTDKMKGGITSAERRNK